jgi:hypothetical protein
MSGILSSFNSKVSFSIMNEITKAIVAPNLKIIRVKIRYRSSNMNHRMENGSYLVDSRIILPATMDIDAICPDLDTQSQLTLLLKDNSSFYLIRSKGIVMDTMMIDQEGFDESSESMSANPVKLRFKQQLVGGFDPVMAATPSQPSDSSVIDQGFSMLSAASGTVGGLYSSVSSYASSAISSVENLV